MFDLNSFSAASEFNRDLVVELQEMSDRTALLPLPIRCWQAADVSGFGNPDAGVSEEGIYLRENYPDKARSLDAIPEFGICSDRSYSNKCQMETV